MPPPPVGPASWTIERTRIAAQNRVSSRGGGSAADRFDWLYAADDLAEWVPRLAGLAEEAEEVYAMFNNNRDDFATRSAQLLRGLLDEAGVQAAGGIEPPPRELTLF